MREPVEILSIPQANNIFTYCCIVVVNIVVGVVVAQLTNKHWKHTQDGPSHHLVKSITGCSMGAQPNDILTQSFLCSAFESVSVYALRSATSYDLLSPLPESFVVLPNKITEIIYECHERV